MTGLAAADMLEWLYETDRDLLLYLNSLHTPWLNTVMIAFSERWFWLPLYACIVVWLILTFRKRTWLLLPAFGLAVGLSDRISSGFFKPYFGRFRPCHDGRICDLLHMPDGCGGYYGFISSHAANSFVLAMLIHLLLKPANPKYRAALWVWAAVVSYSRVYLAVHYPGDILLGSLLGILVAWIVFLVYRFAEKHFFGVHLTLPRT